MGLRRRPDDSTDFPFPRATRRQRAGRLAIFLDFWRPRSLSFSTATDRCIGRSGSAAVVLVSRKKIGRPLTAKFAATVIEQHPQSSLISWPLIRRISTMIQYSYG